MRKCFLLLILSIPSFLFAQRLSSADKKLVKALMNHIQFLASDAVEGRRAGSIGEQKAVDYIIGQYQSLGIQAIGVDGYIQNFPIDEGNALTANSFLKINNQALSLGSFYFPISNSGTGSIISKASISLNESKQVWFKDLNEVLEENTSNPHFDMTQWLVTTAAEIKQKGATALFLFNSGKLVDNIQFYKFDTSKALPIPVLYITKEGFERYFNDELSTYEIEANIQFEHPTRTAHNVIALIDNHAANTVVIGAHLDH